MGFSSLRASIYPLLHPAPPFVKHKAKVDYWVPKNPTGISSQPLQDIWPGVNWLMAGLVGSDTLEELPVLKAGNFAWGVYGLLIIT